MYANAISEMRILVISSRIPAAEKKGDQVVSFFRVMHLARTNEVEVICYGDTAKPEDRDAKQALEEAGIVVHFVRWKTWVALTQLLLAIPNPRMPFQCAFFRSGEFQRVVESIRTRFTPDALYCVMIRIVPNVTRYEGPMFVDMVDSMSLNFSRRASMARGLIRWLLNLEYRRVSVLERQVAMRAIRSFVVSRIDQNAIGTDKVDVIPLGIDMQRFKKEPGDKSEPTVAFTGNMNYQPNADAVLWFVENCWANIKSEIPLVRLVIVGNNPKASISELAEKDKAITVTGRVQSVAAILNTATVAIAPMQSGSGMQFKILEAMACGVPVVTTTLGLGDISALTGKEVLVANTSTDFSRAVVCLIESEQLARDIGDCGLHYVHTNHRWDVLNERFAVSCGIKPAIVN
jgi:glycosyltransferase involved in cell wall biosynthesis